MRHLSGKTETVKMRRREVVAGLAGLAGAAMVRPFASLAQQPALPVIGFVSSRSPGEFATVVDAFRQGLARMGFVEGHNVGIAFRCGPVARTG